MNKKELAEQILHEKTIKHFCDETSYTEWRKCDFAKDVAAAIVEAMDSLPAKEGMKWDINELWALACKKTLESISETFLSEENLKKASFNDGIVIRAIGETIKNFPIPEPPQPTTVTTTIEDISEKSKEQLKYEIAEFVGAEGDEYSPEEKNVACRFIYGFVANKTKRKEVEAISDSEDLKRRVDFYSSQTDKLRDFVRDNNIAKPAQNIFDALYEYVKECKAAKEAISVPAQPSISSKSVEELSEQILKSHPDFEAEGLSEYQNGRYNGIIEGLMQAPQPTVPAQYGVEEEFKRYMSHAYFIGAVDSVGKRVGEEAFNAWYEEIKKPDFLAAQPLQPSLEEKKEDLVASSINTDVSSVVSHSCADSNSIEQRYNQIVEVFEGLLVEQFAICELRDIYRKKAGLPLKCIE